MIPAFNVNPTIATQHEEAIGRAMKKLEAANTKSKAPFRQRSHGNEKNMGTTKIKHNLMQEEWQRRAVLVRAYLEKHPGAGTTDIATGIGVEMKTMNAWGDKFRGSQKEYGIRHVKSMTTKKYNYWRSEDMPKAGDAK